MTLNELIIELVANIHRTSKPIGQPFNDFLQDQISEFFNTRASELRVALPNNPYTVKYTASTPLSTNPAINPSIKSGMALYQEEVNRIYGEFWDAAHSKRAVLKCECGADTLGVMKHSSYCPKHTKE